MFALKRTPRASVLLSGRHGDGIEPSILSTVVKTKKKNKNNKNKKEGKKERGLDSLRSVHVQSVSCMLAIRTAFIVNVGYNELLSSSCLISLVCCRGQCIARSSSHGWVLG